MKMRKFAAAFWLTCLLLCSAAVTVFGAAAVKSTEYEGNGQVEVEFSTKVNYRKVKVSVRDAAGKKYKTAISGKDSDDLTFRIKGVRGGRTYTFTIGGVRKRGESRYASVKGKIWVPKTEGSVPVNEIDYDKKDREVEFDFKGRVEWNEPVVSIKSGKKQYVLRILEKDDDGIEVKVKKLKKGKIYRFTISGIRKSGDPAFTTISGSFMA